MSPVVLPTTRAYIATREHPTLGMLVKIGSSRNPRHRCPDMGARLITVLPHRCERELRRLLRPLQVWPNDDPLAARARWEKPIYGGLGEWHEATDAAMDFLQAYARCAIELEPLLREAVG